MPRDNPRPARSRGSTGLAGVCIHAPSRVCTTRGVPPAAPARQLHLLTGERIVSSVFGSRTCERLSLRLFRRRLTVLESRTHVWSSGDQYRATETRIPQEGTLSLVFEPKGGGEKQVMKVFDMPASGGVAMAMYVTSDVFGLCCAVLCCACPPISSSAPVPGSQRRAARMEAGASRTDATILSWHTP